MPARHSAPLTTLEEFERLPDSGWRTELVRGRVVREPPAGMEHGWLAGRVFFLTARFVEEHRLGIVVAAETGFVLADTPPTVRGPDAAFIAAHRLPPETTNIRGFARMAPDLAVEVISPSNTRTAMRGKVRDYLAAGTRLVWVLDPDHATVSVSRPDGTADLRRTEDHLDGEDALPGFRVPVAELFTPPIRHQR